MNRFGRDALEAEVGGNFFIAERSQNQKPDVDSQGRVAVCSPFGGSSFHMKYATGGIVEITSTGRSCGGLNWVLIESRARKFFNAARQRVRTSMLLPGMALNMFCHSRYQRKFGT